MLQKKKRELQIRLLIPDPPPARLAVPSYICEESGLLKPGGKHWICVINLKEGRKEGRRTAGGRGGGGGTPAWKRSRDEDHLLWEEEEADSPGEIKEWMVPKTSGKVQLEDL